MRMVFVGRRCGHAARDARESFFAAGAEKTLEDVAAIGFKHAGQKFGAVVESGVIQD